MMRKIRLSGGVVYLAKGYGKKHLEEELNTWNDGWCKRRQTEVSHSKMREIFFVEGINPDTHCFFVNITQKGRVRL